MNFLEKALTFIFPTTCGICGVINKGYLCKKCKKDLIFSNIFLNQSDSYTCKKEYFIDEHFYLFSYEGIIREKILQYKFNEQSYLFNTFSEFFVNNKKLYGFLKKYDIIVPVPISKLRKRERGYNQSELIAKKIAAMESITFEPNILVKIKNNKSQSNLNKKQRLENVKNVYEIKNLQKIKEKNILIFDDIYTTGATTNECARILKKKGCKKVGVLTIAKDLEKETINKN